jgi:lipopolysaccharide biosynthesis regulator YciM
LPLPKTLQTTLFEIVARDGAQAAVARYRQLRRDDTLSGRYNFGEWEINELARRLKEGGQDEAAIALMEMNGEFYPKSASIDWDLGELHRLRGDTARALARYRAALEKAPQMEQARRRIEELEKKPQ